MKGNQNPILGKPQIGFQNIAAGLGGVQKALQRAFRIAAGVSSVCVDDRTAFRFFGKEEKIALAGLWLCEPAVNAPYPSSDDGKNEEQQEKPGRAPRVLPWVPEITNGSSLLQRCGAPQRAGCRSRSRCAEAVGFDEIALGVGGAVQAFFAQRSIEKAVGSFL